MTFRNRSASRVPDVTKVPHVFVFPSAIDVTYLLEEGAGRRLRRRTLGFGDFVGRK